MNENDPMTDNLSFFFNGQYKKERKNNCTLCFFLTIRSTHIQIEEKDIHR